jgi:hypothetical protein
MTLESTQPEDTTPNKPAERVVMADDIAALKVTIIS